MRTVLATVVSLVVLALGWALIAYLLFAIGLVGTKARDEAGLLGLITWVMIWILSPGVGGFFAIHVTSSLFASISVEKLYVAFVSVLGTVVGLISLFGIIFLFSGQTSAKGFVFFVLQAIPIFVGARIGRATGEARRP